MWQPLQPRWADPPRPIAALALVALVIPPWLIVAAFSPNRHGYLAVGMTLTILTAFVSASLARNRCAMRTSREVLRAAVDTINEGILVIDEHRRMPVLNARAVALLDLPPHLARPGGEFDALLEWQLENGEYDGEGAAALRRLVESGGIERDGGVHYHTRRNGTILEIRTQLLASGITVRTFTDITQQIQAARSLAEARDVAEAAARIRSEFLAVMSHEIRTPLNGVIGVAALLDETVLDPVQREYVRLIRQSGDHLLELVNDTLDFSRLEANRVELEEADFNPRTLAGDALALFATQAEAKGLVLSLDADAAAPCRVSGDPHRLRQILLNLIGNAVKFTAQGGIRVGLRAERSDDGTVRLLFRVADSGIGMAPEMAGRIFEAFTQEDRSISRRFGGSGLGLAICRRLVELMGGQISVESTLGMGSVFLFDVRLKAASAGAARPDPEHADPGNADSGKVALGKVGLGKVGGGEVGEEPATEARDDSLAILLAEDNPTNRLVATRFLERLGHRIDAVENGAEALSALRARRYDLVLMDVMMPEVDGLTATRAIRAGEKRGTHIPIVGLTAGASEQSLAACLEAGMDAATSKPVTPQRLQAALMEGINVARTQGLENHPAVSRIADLAEALGEDVVGEIAQTFAEDMRTNLDALREAARVGDAPALRQLAHSIRGAASNIGEEELGGLANMLEQDGGSMSAVRIEAAISAMEQGFAAALDRLRAYLPVETA